MSPETFRDHAYENKFARYYDVLTSHKDYPSEAEALRRWIEVEMGEGVRRILEVGCGTGSHARLLSGFGHDITAIDLAADMIAVAREKPSPVRFLAGDVATLDEKGFDVVLSLFNVVNCILSFEALERFFSAIVSRLRPGGLLLFECWNPIAVIASPSVAVERIFLHEGKRFIRLVTPSADFFRQRLTLTYDVSIYSDGEHESRHSEPLDRFTSVHELFLYTPYELRLVLGRCGFRDIAFATALPELRQPTETDRMLAVTCRRGRRGTTALGPPAGLAPRVPTGH